MFIIREMRNTAAMTHLHQRREARTPQLQPNAPTAHGHGRVFRAWDEVSDHASSTTSPPLPLATAHKVLSAWDERPHQPQPEYPSSASFNREHQQVPSSFLLRRLYQGEAQTTGCAVVRWCGGAVVRVAMRRKRPSGQDRRELMKVFYGQMGKT